MRKDGSSSGGDQQNETNPDLSSHAEKTLASILSSSFEAIIVTDNTTRITTFNKGAEKIFGYKSDTIIGQSIDKLIPSRFQNAHHDHVASFAKNRQSSFQMNKVNDVVGLRSDGEEFPIAASVSKVFVDDGFIFSIIIRDMTDAVAQEKILRLAMKKTEAATQAKSDFLATMSHEIRTPLHGILGMAQLLKRTLKRGPHEEFVGAIEDSGRTLLSLINDILDLSRVEAGLMKLEPAAIEIERLIKEILPGIEVQIREKGLGLEVSIENNVPKTIQADRLRLGQALTNLMGNAVKFTQSGSISLLVSAQDDETVKFTIKDTGIGIPKDQQKGIFDRFSQTDTSIQRRFGGSGLGLSIVKEIVSLMSGEIGVDSMENQGATFWFTIPTSCPNVLHQESPVISHIDQLQDKTLSLGTGKTALVVDDDETNRLVCASILKELGFKIIECDSGMEALDTLMETHVDIVFMDLHMPNMSGDECIRAIRNSGASFNNVPIVVLTADASESAADLAKSAGADDSYTKPFTLKEMSEVSEKLASPNPQSSQSDSALHIVLIDDDNTEQLLLRELISDLNHNIQFDYFENAQSFCEQGHSTEETLLLLDGNIPPFSSHEESLQLIQTQGCQARIYLLSADKYTKTLDVEGLNIVAPLDKLKIQSSENLESFIESAIASKTL